MKKLTSLFVIINLCALSFAPVAAYGQGGAAVAKLRKNAAATPNHYIVVLNDNSVAKKDVRGIANGLTRAHNGTLGFTYENALRGFSVQMNEAQAEALSRHPQVAFVEEDTEVEGASTQTNAPWQLDRLDQRDPAPNSSYTYASDGVGVNAYVIDGGIRMTHQEFGGRAAFAFDNVGDGRNGTDCNGHGTHVAGIIGGATYGVAKAAKLWSVRVLNCSNQALASRILEGIDWVAGNHIKPAVANLSFVSGVGNDALDLSVRNLIKAGVTTVVAAGNNNGDAALRSPARVAEAITVAATDQNDVKTSLSNFGAVVDVFAPGAAIVSANSADDTSTFTRTGTSSAAPHVAGLVARYLSTRPGDAPDAVSQAIMNAATPGKVSNPGAGSPNLLAYAGITLSDDFNDNTRDASKWSAPTAPDFTVAEANKKLEITPGAAATGYDGYRSATNVDLTDSRVSVQVTTAQRIDGFGTYFVLGSAGNTLIFGNGGSNLVLQQEVGGVTTTTTVLYNPSLHRFWRIRHNRADDTVNWENSGDGKTWMLLRSEPRQFSLTDLQVVLTAGKNLATTPTQKATFDTLWHEPNPTPTVAIADNFDDNQINPAMWVMDDPASPTTVSEQNGRIEVTPQPNTSGYNGLNITGGFDFRDKTLQVEVQPASQAGAVYTYFSLSLDGSNSLVFAVGANTFTCDSTVNGVLDRTQLTWDATIRYWRFRHDTDTNTVSFDTSADGATWTTRKTVAAGFALSAVRSGIGAGATGATNAAPGTAIFDNFRLERFAPRFPQSDDFNDNLRDLTKWNAAGAMSNVMLDSMKVVEQNGQLQITPPSNTTGYDGYYSATKIDLTDAHATVELVQNAGTATGVETTFKIADPVTGHYMLFSVRGTVLLMEGSVGGGRGSTSYVYNAAQQRFLRFRHNHMDQTFGLSFSPDGKTWTKTSFAMGMSFTSVKNWQIQLYAGKSTSTATATTAIFDNLRIERNEGGKTR